MPGFCCLFSPTSGDSDYPAILALLLWEPEHVRLRERREPPELLIPALESPS